MTGSFEVREATSSDRLGVRRVLDAAMLDVRDDLCERIEAGDVLVANKARDGASDRDASDEDTGDEDATILGALVLLPRESGAHVDAVAVRRARRAQGVGTALVRIAAERHARLTAEFDASVRPFYESLGFEISPVEDATDADRLRGCYDGNVG